MPNTDLDYFEIAKKLTAAHSEALGDVYLKNTDLGIAREVVLELVARLQRTADRLEFVSEVILADSYETERVLKAARDTLKEIGAEP